MTTPAREGLPELPEHVLLTYGGMAVWPRAQVAAHGWACYDAGYRAALAAIASQPTQGGEAVEFDSSGVTITEGGWTGTYVEWKARHGIANLRLEPACETCRGYGMIDTSSGQTPDSYQPDAQPCPDCTPPPPSDAAQGERKPDGYAYRYPHYDGGTVIRFTCGQEVNGVRPTEAVPYFYGSPPPSQPVRVDEVRRAFFPEVSTGIGMVKMAAMRGDFDAVLRAAEKVSIACDVYVAAHKGEGNG